MNGKMSRKLNSRESGQKIFQLRTSFIAKSGLKKIRPVEKRREIANQCIFSYEYSQKFQKQNWESKSVLFNDPSVPVTYPTSGLRVEPDEVLKVPIKITKVCAVMYICKISSKFSVFS